MQSNLKPAGPTRFGWSSFRAAEASASACSGRPRARRGRSCRRVACDGRKQTGRVCGGYFLGTDLTGRSAERVDQQIGFDPFSPELLRKVLLPESWEILKDLTWPAGVRHYTYRKDPELPSGNSPYHDNVQLAFNVLPPARKDWYACPPGTMPGYASIDGTEYEYALNPLVPRYGAALRSGAFSTLVCPTSTAVPTRPSRRWTARSGTASWSSAATPLRALWRLPFPGRRSEGCAGPSRSAGPSGSLSASTTMPG